MEGSDVTRSRRSASALAASCSWISLAAVLLLSFVCSSAVAAPVQQQPGAVAIEAAVLSGRPDMVSGGSTLVGVTLPFGVPAESLRFTVDGKPANARVVQRMGRRVQALISGLSVGEHHLQVAGSNASPAAQLAIRNHPRSGPIFSGPHLSPFECRTEESGLGPPLDRHCSAQTRYDWFYFTRSGERRSLPDPTGPRPADLAHTTTLDGRTVPFIVRVESGTINRSIYRIGVLDDPAQQALPSATGWNQRVVLRFYPSAGVQYNQGINRLDQVFRTSEEETQSVTALGRGFAYVLSTLNINKVNVNDPLAAETAMMLREHIAKSYGVPRWMVGMGSSGAAIQQLLIAQNYPGILDGVMPDLSYPDVFSTAMAATDCRLLLRYFTAHPATDATRRAFEGHFKGTCEEWSDHLAGAIDATDGGVDPPCGLTDRRQVYHPVTNPQGVRCSIYDVNAASLGRDPDTGFARRALDNLGVQYGLAGLRAGDLTVEQFLDLNEKIGGFDQDGRPAPGRTVADSAALTRSYALGRVGTGSGGLATTPIFHLRPYAEPLGDIHSGYNDIKLRQQLLRANRRFDNQVIWVVPDPDLAPWLGLHPAEQQALARLSREVVTMRLDLMTAWLDALTRDGTPATADKVARVKPGDALDSCWSPVDRVRHREPATLFGPGVCNQLYPKTPSPRMVAGGPVTDDILKCQLKPIDFADYAPAVFTPAQRDRLAVVFPEGVCDYSRPGVGQVERTRTWVRY
ncbi:DUF6351 family protein [Aquabacterium sp. A7-Y]|uniref:DUF6351 family protein n=1 Tax=Aquabacterium sp. A7-Y TaxID=1349605 RepID=UPI00223D0C5D|nr:DUF6351 family protein [Aquabacterium sp. A7-Y]MCW7541143.1 DUF6351 family protein [Aquabacterium sp. A7-Y]